MDPDACLKELLELAETVRRDYEDGASNGVDQDDANRLGELIEALDEWIRKGGFLPSRWQKGRKK